jgi:hypothetical protein
MVSILASIDWTCASHQSCQLIGYRLVVIPFTGKVRRMLNHTITYDITQAGQALKPN